MLCSIKLMIVARYFIKFFRYFFLKSFLFQKNVVYLSVEIRNRSLKEFEKYMVESSSV